MVKSLKMDLKIYIIPSINIIFSTGKCHTLNLQIWKKIKTLILNIKFGPKLLHSCCPWIESSPGPVSLPAQPHAASLASHPSQPVPPPLFLPPSPSS
jgi:hypothetical protein